MLDFKNQDLAIFNKGDFQPINREFLTETTCAIRPLLEIQERYQKLDNDTFFNEYKDSMIASYLGFDLVNVQKHGFDGKKSFEENVFLEVKQASLSAKNGVQHLMIPMKKKHMLLWIRKCF